jgi:glycerol-3-phosphate dehydrogenase (NAD(P)+)
MSRPIAVLGAGAWGLALALSQERCGRTVRLWGQPGGSFTQLQNSRTSSRLPDIILPPQIALVADPAEACDGAELALLTVPSRGLSGLAAAISSAPPLPLVLCAKGFAPQGRLWLDALADMLPGRPLAVLSGPSFATEVARGLPTALVIAASDARVAQSLMENLAAPSLRPYASTDVIGVQTGGALKNVLAIACGISDGLKLGDNARAALITRGLAELTRLGLALGGRAETFAGLAGLGDLILTATSPQSRNYRLGRHLGDGMTPAQALTASAGVAEGADAAALAVALASRHGIICPITATVDAVLNRAAPLRDAVETLLARPLKSESDT